MRKLSGIELHDPILAPFVPEQIEDWENGRLLPLDFELVRYCYRTQSPARDAAKLQTLRRRLENELPPALVEPKYEPPVGLIGTQDIYESEYVERVNSLVETIPTGEGLYSGVFISYRRDDAPHFAGRLHCMLTREFGDNRIFIDVEHVAPALDFEKKIEEALEECDALLVVIGVDWLDAARSSSGNHWTKSPDYVQLEIGIAIRRGLRLFPILVDGARMPDLGALPTDLALLSRYSGIHVAHATFGRDYKSLRSELLKAIAL
jgi:hypothetical protein